MRPVAVCTETVRDATPALDLLARTPIATVMVDRRGGVTWRNDAAAELFEFVDGEHPELADMFLELECPSILSQLRFVLDPELAETGRMAATLRRHDRRTTPVDVHLTRADDHHALLQVVDPPVGPTGSILERQRAFCDALVSLSALAREHIEHAEFYASSSAR